MKPQRMCIVCREMKEKTELFRVVKSNAEVSVDMSFRAQGRGAYICRSLECVTAAKKRSALEHSFSMKINPEIYDRLEALVENAEG